MNCTHDHGLECAGTCGEELCDKCAYEADYSDLEVIDGRIEGLPEYWCAGCYAEHEAA